MVADIEELEMDASELHARRLNAKDVSTPMKGGNFIFPVADGTVKICWWREQRLRTSTLTRDRPERGEAQEILQGKSDELHSPTQLQNDSTWDDEEAKMTSGRSQENSFIVITLYLESNCTCRKKNNFLFRWSTSTLPERHTHPWMYYRRKYWRFLECGWRKRIIRCMDTLHKIHLIYWTKGHLWRIHMVRGETYEETNNLSSCMARYVETIVWCIEKESKTKKGYRETKARQCQTLERNWSSQWKPLVESWKFRCQQQCP